MAEFIKIFCVTGLGILILCLTSCEQEQKPVKKTTQITVVTKSIDLPEKSVKSKAAGKKMTVHDNADTIPVTRVQTVAPDQVPGPNQPDKKGIVQQGASSDAAILSSPVTGGQTQAVTGADPILNEIVYDSKGRLDPFIPLISEKKEESPVVDPEDKKPMRILTPLEKMDISQIRLVAVIEMKDRSIAMVEEASGKGYEVKLGTYMGRNGGQVSAINKEGILVKEYVKDFKGIRKARIQEIKFHKSEDGE